MIGFNLYVTNNFSCEILVKESLKINNVIQPIPNNETALLCVRLNSYTYKKCPLIIDINNANIFIL